MLAELAGPSAVALAAAVVVVAAGGPVAGPAAVAAAGLAAVVVSVVGLDAAPVGPVVAGLVDSADPVVAATNESSNIPTSLNKL